MLSYSRNLSNALQKSTHAVRHNFRSFTEMLLNSLSDSGGRCLLGMACLHLRVAASSAVTFCSPAQPQAMFLPIAHPNSWLAPAGRGKILLILSGFLLHWLSCSLDCFVSRLNALWCHKKSPVYFIFNERVARIFLTGVGCKGEKTGRISSFGNSELSDHLVCIL